MHRCEGKGAPREDGTHLQNGVFQPIVATVTHTNAKKIQDLVKLKAIGPEIATVLAGEVLYRPFSNRRELASYVGLTPSHFQVRPAACVPSQRW